MPTTSVPDPFPELARSAQMLRARAPEQFDWFIQNLGNVRGCCLEALGNAEAGDLLVQQGHVRCMTRLLETLTAPAKPPAP